MFDLSLYGPYCSAPGTCSYNNGFTDGYIIGTVFAISLIVCIETLITIIKSCKESQQNDAKIE